MKGQGGNILYAIILVFELPRLLLTIWSNLLFSLVVKIGCLKLITASFKIQLVNSIKLSYYCIYTYFSIVEWSLFWTSDKFNILRFVLDATTSYIPACHLQLQCFHISNLLISAHCSLNNLIKFFSISSCSGLTVAGHQCPPSHSITPPLPSGTGERKQDGKQLAGWVKEKKLIPSLPLLKILFIWGAHYNDQPFSSYLSELQKSWLY